jgi:TatD DNase family protein
MLIDSHCHLKAAHTSGQLSAVLDRASAAGVTHCITVGTSIADWEMYRTLAASHPARVAFTVGLHPADVDETWDDQLQALPSFFATDPAPVALGEIGLDHFHLPKFPDEAAEIKAQQLAAFRAQLELAYQLNCPVVIHSRDAVDACIDVIDRSGVDWGKVVFHCFTGSADQVRRIVERGGRASFTGIVTYKSAESVRDALRTHGLDRLMVETDAPYLAPDPYRGKPCEPAMLRATAEAVARILGVPPALAFERLHANTVEFYKLVGVCP